MKNMKLNKTLFTGMLVSLIVAVASFVFAYMYECNGVPSCESLLVRGEALYSGAEVLAVSFLLLLLVPQALTLWKKFAIWYLPAMLAVFLTYEGPGAFDLFSPYPQQLFQFVSGVYVIVSALIVLWVFTHSKITKRVPTASPALKNPLLKFLWFVYIGVLVLNVLWVVTA